MSEQEFSEAKAVMENDYETDPAYAADEATILGAWVRGSDAALMAADAAGRMQGFAEGIETAAHWHDQQAARHRNLAIGFRDYLAERNNIDDDDRREILKLAQEQGAHAWRHQVYAKMIRGLAVVPEAVDQDSTR